MKNLKARIACIALLGLLAAPAVQAQGFIDRWTLSLTPYLWLPSVDGSLRYGPPATGGAPNVGVEGDVLGALEMAFMLAGEARKGRWSIASDYIYLDLSNDSSRIRSVDFNAGPVNILNTGLNINSNSEITGSLWTLVGGYSVIYQPRHTMDVIGGFRYFNIKASTSWQLAAAVTGPGGVQTFARSGSVSKSDELWDAIIGVRGRLKVGNGNWFIPYHFDAGAGSSQLTWQGLLGAGYKFDWADFLLAYRYLSYEQSGAKLIENMSFGGFGAGLTFRF